MRRFTRLLFSLPHNGGAHSAPARERRGAKGPRERPSRGVGRSPTSGGRNRTGDWIKRERMATLRRESGFAHLPEHHARYAVLLHLDMQGLVVGSKSRAASLLFPLVS